MVDNTFICLALLSFRRVRCACRNRLAFFPYRPTALSWCTLTLARSVHLSCQRRPAWFPTLRVLRCVLVKESSNVFNVPSTALSAIHRSGSVRQYLVSWYNSRLPTCRFSGAYLWRNRLVRLTSVRPPSRWYTHFGLGPTMHYLVLSYNSFPTLLPFSDAPEEIVSKRPVRPLNVHSYSASVRHSLSCITHDFRPCYGSLGVAWSLWRVRPTDTDPTLRSFTLPPAVEYHRLVYSCNERQLRSFQFVQFREHLSVGLWVIHEWHRVVTRSSLCASLRYDVCFLTNGLCFSTKTWCSAYGAGESKV
jgi:hypothetical protein